MSILEDCGNQLMKEHEQKGSVRSHRDQLKVNCQLLKPPEITSAALQLQVQEEYVREIGEEASSMQQIDTVLHQDILKKSCNAKVQRLHVLLEKQRAVPF